MTQRKALVIDSGHQTFDELDATDIPALAYDASGAAAAAAAASDPVGTATAAVSAHAGASDPHPTYLTAAEGNAVYDAIGAAAAVTATSIGALTHPQVLARGLGA